MQTLTKTLTGAQIIIHTLKHFDIDTIFGYPGRVVLDVYNELSKQTDIKHYLMRHEQAACHAAEGYARVSGKCGVVLVTSGPGATNIVTGLSNAQLDSSPLVAITGQVSAENLHKNTFQEVDIIDITKSCTKKNFQVTDVKNLQSTLYEAFYTAMSGRKGPVLVDITKNVFSQVEEISCELPELDKSFELPENISQTAEIINSASRPVIIAGGGASYEEVQKISHLLNIPVVTTMMGFYPYNDSNYMGMAGVFGFESANKVLQESDLILAVGTRLNDRINCFIKGKNLININIDEISKFPSKSTLVGDSKAILSEMINYIKQSGDTDWLDYAKSLKNLDSAPKKCSNHLHSYEIMEEIASYIYNKEVVVTTEVGQHQILAAKYLKLNKNFITSGGLGTMGFGFPAAIGASIAKPEIPVICIAGDGSIQMNIQELAVCKDYNLPVKIFIFNNGYLGMVRQLQEKSGSERFYATKISNPDFIKLAQSYGISGVRVEKREDIKLALDKAFSTNEPFITDFVTESMEIV